MKEELLTITDFNGFGLAEPLLRALTARDHQTPTPIQSQAIGGLMQGRDMLGIAQTGTGKTGAFVLPILHRLAGTDPAVKPRRPRALILAPTRELAIQIGDEARAYSKFLHLRHTVIFGGVKEGAQITALARGVDLLIATPGRLLDLVERKKADLRGVEIVVLDEADRMLDMGFIRDIRKLIAAVPEQHQALMFSATMPPEIARLADGFLTDPMRVEVAPQSTPIERIKQTVHHLQGDEKLPRLVELLDDKAMDRVIVFTRTKHRANKVTEYLGKAGIEARAIHGNKTQSARQLALKTFKSGETRVLVATDIAARGIDVDGVSHVVNFDLPNEAESYVHRIGRTARAGNTGVAIAFCDPGERGYLAQIEKLTKLKLAIVGPGPIGPDEAPPTPGRNNNGGGRRGGQGRGGKPAHAKSGKPKSGGGGGGAAKPGNSRRRPRRRRAA